jgi:hypothetical protein
LVALKLQLVPLILRSCSAIVKQQTKAEDEVPFIYKIKIMAGVANGETGQVSCAGF